MKDLKPIIASNISELRVKKGLTQIDLAEQLNYSDKAVSKWERGESLPDISVLYEIANMFDVTLDYLVTEEHEPVIPTPIVTQIKKRKKINHALITSLSILLVWLLATTIFVIWEYASPNSSIWVHLMTFAFAIPISFIIWLVFNSIWFKRRRNFIIISLLIWSILAVMYLTVLILGVNAWEIFLIGIPGQAIVIFWSQIKSTKAFKKLANQK